ncbi:histidine phosphatase family protein [Ramlibacter ginsenosidimutans]|uniref:Histidine phosphatase family protein n=1 Tax=Ramlibacter ginsenosidimutans TaxID=502333 RepID=A0A934TSC0_9BURK|nr:histidine phosphatase family protein [Ramlibacter ginsenosidimutans]MBK6006503.1 histidine phosphatase family protein [Ramlibacter ginsenosidimutans]
MDLIIWRHAEAVDPGEQLADIDRPLTPKGEKQAARVGAWLDRHLPEGTRVLCSPALRCQQTALALGRKFKVRDELAPGASAQDLLAAAQWPHARHPVLIVGHQPVLGEVLAQLLRIAGGQCGVRKGAVWWLRGRERDGDEQAGVWAVQSPETV